MTKQEFETQFNALLTAPTPDPVKIAEFRNNVLNDYDELTTTTTTLGTTQESIKGLNETITQLRETNMKLFMMNPTMFTPTATPATDPTATPATDPTATPATETTQPKLDDVVTAMFTKPE